MAMLIVLVVTMHVIVLLDAGGGFVSDPQLVNCLQKSAPFDPQQSCTEKRDEAVADDLNDANGVAHQLRGRAKENGGDRDDGHRGQGLHDGRGERERDASAPCLLIGEQVRGNHRLAMSQALPHEKCRTQTRYRSTPKMPNRRFWLNGSSPPTRDRRSPVWRSANRQCRRLTAGAVHRMDPFAPMRNGCRR